MPIICLSFFLSGFAALIYEILWVRLITLFCGNTTLATSAVLAAFMAGLALGSFFGGRAADRGDLRRLLLIYACLEAAIALSGWLSRPAIRFIGAALLPYGLLSASQGVQSLVYFSTSLLVLILPTSLMGATLPILTRWASVGRAQKEADRPLSLLYGLNTLGAVLGAASAGFIFIPSLGVRRTLLLAAALNSASALMVFLLWRQGRGEETPAPAPEQTPGPPLPWLPAAALFISGAAAMVCEVAWTRAFAQVIGSSTYAFTIMLAVILTGLAAGSLLFHALRRQKAPGLFGLGLLFGVIALTVRTALPLFNVLPYAVIRLFPIMARGEFSLHAIQILLCASVMAVPTVLMGAVLPWAVASAGPERGRIGAATGTYYSANTLGAIIGSALAGLALVPMLGTEKALVCASWLYAGGAVLAVAFSSEEAGIRSAFAAGTVLLMIEAALLCPSWDPRILSSGMFLYGGMYAEVRGYKGFLKRMLADKVIFYRDGRIATVAVLEGAGEERYLRINGKTDASQGRDIATQTLLGVLPLLMHPQEPRRSLVIGLGSGASAAVLASGAGMEAVDIVEIEPAVSEAAALFAKANRNVLRDPRARVIHADARQFLAAAGLPYDIISSEPSNPWVSGVAGLYTLEAFESARSRLAPDGVFCQWFHSYHMSVDDFRMIMRTFSAVFPHSMLMFNGGTDFFLLGSRKPWSPDYAKIQRIFSTGSPFLRILARARSGFDHPFTFLAATFLLTDAEVHEMSDAARVNFDDLPILEFSAPRSIEHGQAQRISRWIVTLKRSALPEGLRGFKESPKTRSLLYVLQGEACLDAGDTGLAKEALFKAVQADPGSARAQAGLGLLAEALGRDQEAMRRYRSAVALDGRYAAARFLLGALCVKHERLSEAKRQLEKGLELEPGDPTASLNLGIAYLRQGRRAETIRLVQTALAQPIINGRTHENLWFLLMTASP
ncbi:MAG: fused MFS/spermidine synthase [Elusimicrobia bacterium]|nr:fused MFS/spermidine synthase [Elusimicrobiota bacterium]